MFQSKSTDTVQLSETVLKLDALYASYDGILSEVKQQLATLDVTEDQLTRITNKLASNSTLREGVALKAVKDLARALADASQEEIEGKRQLEGLVSAISDRVMSNIAEVINIAIEIQIKQRLEEIYTPEKMDELMTDFLAHRPATVTAFKSQDCLELMLQVLGYQKVDTNS